MAGELSARSGYCVAPRTTECHGQSEVLVKVLASGSFGSLPHNAFWPISLRHRVKFSDACVLENINWACPAMTESFWVPVVNRKSLDWRGPFWKEWAWNSDFYGSYWWGDYGVFCTVRCALHTNIFIKYQEEIYKGKNKHSRIWILCFILPEPCRSSLYSKINTNGGGKPYKKNIQKSQNISAFTYPNLQLLYLPIQIIKSFPYG